jgi:hypothetical protein
MSLETNKQSGNWHDVTNARTLSFYATEDLVHGDLISSADISFIPPKGYTYDFCAVKQSNSNLASFQVFEPNRIKIKAGTIFTAVAFLGYASNEDAPPVAETTTTITNTVAGHKIADYTNELGSVVGVNETITELNVLVASGNIIANYTDEDGVTVDLRETSTTLSQNIVDGKISFTNEEGVTTNANILSLDVGNDLSIGSDGGLLYQDVAETTTTITNTIVGHKIADYTNELGSVVAINETTTTFSQNIADGKISFINESGVTADAVVVSADAGNTLLVGSDGGVFYDGAGIVSGATWDDATNTITINFVDGSSVDVPIVDAISSFINPTIYTADGTLTSNRILDGDSWNQGIDFGELAYFNVYATNFYSESQSGNTIENGATGISLQSMATGQTLTLQGDIVNLGGVTDTYVSFLAQDDTKNKILVLDNSDKLFWREASSLLNNIYNTDGVLTGNRTLDGDNFNYDLNILNTNNFSVNTFELNFNSDDHAQLSSNGYVNLSANTSGSFSANQNLSLNAGTQAELTAVNEVNLIAPKTTVSKDFFLNDLTPVAQTDILNIDPLSGNVSYVPLSSIVPNVQNGLSLSGSDIELGGTLLHNTDIIGDGYAYNLNLNQLNGFNVDSNDFYVYSNNSGTLEVNNNLNLLANDNLFGAVAKNTDLRSIPDWDLTGDLSGRMYSGNDVLDLFGTLGANIRGTGFFNKRTSNNVHHYIFAGDTTGIGGTEDEITLGMSDFGLTGYNSEIGLVRKNFLGNGEYRVNLDSPTAYYLFNVQNEDSLNELFANTGYTHSRTTTSQTSNYDYTSNNHYYELRFDDNGGEYLALNNRSIIGPENGYFNLFKTSAVTNVTDGILSNGTTLNLTGFNIYTLPTYSNTVSEKIVVRDNTTGDLKDSISITSVSTKKIHVIIGAGAGYTANLNEFVIFQGVATGTYSGEIVTLPTPSIDGDTITVKVKTNDVLRLDGAGYLIDGNSTFDIDGTIVSGQQPSVTLEYDLTLNEWQVI